MRRELAITPNQLESKGVRHASTKVAYAESWKNSLLAGWFPVQIKMYPCRVHNVFSCYFFSKNGTTPLKRRRTLGCSPQQQRSSAPSIECLHSADDFTDLIDTSFTPVKGVSRSDRLSALRHPCLCATHCTRHRGTCAKKEKVKG